MCDIVDDEWEGMGRNRTADIGSLWWTRKERAVRAVCIKGKDEEWETDRKADGDHEREACCAKAKYTWGHDSVAARDY